jgi:hypothetical protein
LIWEERLDSRWVWIKRLSGTFQDIGGSMHHNKPLTSLNNRNHNRKSNKSQGLGSLAFFPSTEIKEVKKE